MEIMAAWILLSYLVPHFLSVGTRSAQSSQAHKTGFIMVETNFRVIAYTGITLLCMYFYYVAGSMKIHHFEYIFYCEYTIY